MHHTGLSELRDAATSPSCQLMVLIVWGRWTTSSDHLPQPRENGCLQNIKQSIRHVKISEIHISEPRVNPSSYTIHSDQKDTSMWFPGRGPDILLPPGALGLLQFSSAAPEGSQAARDTLKDSMVLVPHSPNR